MYFCLHSLFVCVCVRLNVLCDAGFSLQGPRNALCQCSCRHLNRHETHFQWDTNHLFLSQQRAVLQCQPSAISTGISFLAEHWQAFRVSWGHSRPWEAQRASNKWSSGAAQAFIRWRSLTAEPQESKWQELRTNYKPYQRPRQSCHERSPTVCPCILYYNL